MPATSPSYKPPKPRLWCDPPEAFGKVHQRDEYGEITEKVARREWKPPVGNDPNEVAQFRAAVMQNAISVHVREFKNGEGIRRSGLAEKDGRLDSKELWDARLNGRENLTTADIAVLAKVMPAALPDPSFIAVFIAVAEGEPPPHDWPYPDTSAP